MTVNSRIIKTFLQWSPDAVDVPLTNGLRVQILPTVDDLPNARKHQFAAFIASEQLLVVWDDEAMNLIPRAKAIEKELMELVWKTGEPEEEEEATEKKGPAVVETEINEETGEYVSKRPTNIQNSILVAITLTIVITMLGAGGRQIAIELSVDRNYLRLCFLLLIPIQIFFTLVSFLTFRKKAITDILSKVLRTGHRWLHRSINRTSETNDRKLPLLLCFASTPPRGATAPTRHHSMSCLQGRPCLCHRTNRQVDQTSHFHLRTSRWLRQHVHQRRWSSDHSGGGTPGPH